MTGECVASRQQVASACSGLSHGATILKSSPLTGGQSSSQCRLDAGSNEAAGKGSSVNHSTSAGGHSSSILVASGNLIGSGHKQTGAAAKVVHSKISSSNQSSEQQQRPFKRMSSEDHLLLTGAHRCAHHEASGRLAASNGLAASGAANSAHRRPRMASLSRLNELNGATTTATTSSHCGHDESISSLANDSFANTSQENTPCTAGGQHAHNLSSAAGQRYFSGKGSDSMLWNQSVYSIDYCSDCCPSYCHSFCPGCSSNGCDGGETNSTGGGGGGQTTCVHASSGTVLDSLQQQQAADTDPDDFDSALCDQSIGGGPGSHLSRQVASSGALDEPAAAGCSLTSSSVRRRKSEEQPETRMPEPTSYYYDCDELYHHRTHHHKPSTCTMTSAGTSATMVARGKFRDNGGGSKTPPSKHLNQTSRSQTMEMRTIVVDKSGAGKLKLRQSIDEDMLVQVQAGQTSKQLSKQNKLASCTSGAATPLVYALQAAASSAYTVAQMAATANVQSPSAADIQYGAGSSAKHQFTSTKDKYSDKVATAAAAAATRQPAPKAADLSALQKTNIAANQTVDAPSQQQPGVAGGGAGGAIQLGLEMVKSMESSRRKSTDYRRHNHYHRKSSCLSYHDDYEYSYGLVQSNSDSENYYPEELSGEGDTSAGSLAKDETSDEGGPSPGKVAYYDDYYDDIADNDEEDDFEHDGRLTLGKLASGESGTPKRAQRIDQSAAGAGARHRLTKATATAGSVKYKGSAGSLSSSLARQRPTTAASTSASATTTTSRPLQLDDHRINSVTLIAATLSAGGAIVESSGGASSSHHQQQHQHQQQQQPSVGGDKFTGDVSIIQQQQQKQRQEQNQTSRNVEDEKQQAEQVGYLTTL